MAKLNVKTPNGTTKSIDLDKVLINSDITASSTNGSISVKGTNVSVYTHPTGNGNNHIPSNGGSNQILRYSAAGTAAWSNETTYSAGNGLQLSGNTFKLTDGTIVQRASVARGTNPSSNLYSEFIWCDNSTSTSSDHRLALFSRGLLTDGRTHAGMYAYNATSGSTANSSIVLYQPKGGTQYTYAPTPPDGDSSTKIATTAWVGAQGGVNGISIATNGAIMFKSGLIIQWGHVSAPAGNIDMFAIEFPIDFPNKPLAVWGFDVDSRLVSNDEFPEVNKYSFVWFCNCYRNGQEGTASSLKSSTCIVCNGDPGKMGWVAIGY